MADPEENEANSEKFNEEIVCSHGNLSLINQLTPLITLLITSLITLPINHSSSI